YAPKAYRGFESLRLRQKNPVKLLICEDFVGSFETQSSTIIPKRFWSRMTARQVAAADRESVLLIIRVGLQHRRRTCPAREVQFQAASPARPPPRFSSHRLRRRHNRNLLSAR